jgi:hypothetical protein
VAAIRDLAADDQAAARRHLQGDLLKFSGGGLQT